MTVPAGSGPDVFAGAGCAVDGSTPRAIAAAEALAASLGLRAARVAPEDRVAYHAAAAMAANFLVTLEGAAERLANTAGIEREWLAPLVRAAVESWVELGSQAALTGPIARGDEAVVASQRKVIEQRTPDLLPLFDALADATRKLVAADEDDQDGRRDARARAARPRATAPRSRSSRRWARSTPAITR